MSDFFEKYKDPRWQRMRLEIMDRDKYTCRRCDSTTKTLNVHHGYYVKGAAPWEYDSESLITLCEECHKIVQGRLQECRELLGYLWDRDDRIYGYLMAVHSSMVGRIIFAKDNEDYWSITQGIADFWGVDPDEVCKTGVKSSSGTWLFHTEKLAKLPKLVNPSQGPEFLPVGFSEDWEQRNVPGDI